jgi:hypothetical protein
MRRFGTEEMTDAGQADRATSVVYELLRLVDATPPSRRVFDAMTA